MGRPGRQDGRNSPTWAAEAYGSETYCRVNEIGLLPHPDVFL